MNHYQEIQNKLQYVNRRESFLSAWRGFGFFVFASAIVWFLFILAEYLGEFNVAIRTLFILTICVLCFAALLVFVMPSVIKYLFKPNYLNIAEKVGNHFDEIRDELKNAMQLVHMKDERHSPTLIDAAFERIYKRTKNLDFKKVTDFSSCRKTLLKTLGISGLMFFLVVIIPGLRSSANRLFHFGDEFIIPQKFLFVIDPGNVSITKGESITIRINAIGSSPARISFMTKSVEQSEYEEKKLSADSTGSFLFYRKDVRSSFEYFAAAEGIQSDFYRVNVIDRPAFGSLTVRVTPPSYANLPETIQKDNGNITALEGSRVRIDITSTKELKRAELIFGDSTKINFTMKEKAASAEFRAELSTDYIISIVDNNGNGNRDPILYSVSVEKDKYPSIEILSPEQDVKLTKSNSVPILTRITDDFGFTKLMLRYKLSSSKYEEPWKDYRQEPVIINTKVVEDNIYYVWDLSSLVLAEGDVATYYLEIYDNDYVNGPKSAKSPMQTVSVPSIDDLFTEADRAHEQSKNDLLQKLEEAGKLKEEFEKLGNELKRDDGDITWEEKEKLKKAMDKFEELNNSLDDIKNKLNDLQKDLSQNSLLSEETMEKYMELQKLFDELGSEEMREAFKRMQEMLEQLSRNQIQQSFENIKANEEYFKKSLERTINLLKRIQIEQKVDELIKRAADIERKLEELLEKTSKANLQDNQQSEELSKRQSDITKGIEKLEETMNDLNNKMSQVEDMPEDEIRKLIEQFQNQTNKQISQSAEQNLKASNKSRTMQDQFQLSQNMEALSQNLNDLQQAIQQKNQMQVFYDMFKITDNLITLSKEEETLMDETALVPQVSNEYEEKIKQQNGILKNLDRVTEQMVDLSQKTFAITPEMGKAIGNARMQMNQAINIMQNRGGSVAPQFQRQAMRYLNEAALLMKGAMEMMMSGGQGGGMMSLMQQLQQLANQQMNLNQLTKMLNQGVLTTEQLAQLQRLANEQALIKKSLEQLNRESKEAGQSKKLAGNLEKILEEMQEVVTNLNSQRLDNELILKQERILSRLLDAQRSINERDFENERESQTGTNVARESPNGLDLSTEEGRNKLRDELIRALKEGYKKDYEELVIKYFEALEKGRSEK